MAAIDFFFKGQSVFVTQVFPLPQPLSVLEQVNISSSKTLLLDFALAMNATNATIRVEALEGFIAGMFVGQVALSQRPSEVIFRCFIPWDNLMHQIVHFSLI